jgi:5-methylcytosine-specific restriction endonuclease McrA
MTFPGSRCPRLRLDPVSYHRLWEEILKRDRWRCQHCGSMSELQVHHIQSRSRLGEDSEKNLITLCAWCHKRIHLRLTD